MWRAFSDVRQGIRSGTPDVRSNRPALLLCGLLPFHASGWIRGSMRGSSASESKDCLIVGMFSKDEAPYAQHYMDMLESQGSSFDVIYFDRYGSHGPVGANEIVFSRYCPTGGSKASKILTMMEYARFIRRVLRAGHYQYVIVLTTLPAIFLNDILHKDYQGNYILDIRDYTYEHAALFRRIEERLIAESFATVLSSRGFLDFLPQHGDYVFTHNIPHSFERFEVTDPGLQDELCIGYVGSIRYEEENAALVRQFSTSQRFALGYWGTQAKGCDLENKCKGVSNVSFHGPYSNDEKKEIYRDIDIINSIYGIQSRETTTAVPNRFYDAAIYGKPILVSKGTFLADLVVEYGLGIPVDVFDDDVPALLSSHLESFDEREFDAACKRLLDDVERDLRDYREVVLALICNNKVEKASRANRQRSSE